MSESFEEQLSRINLMAGGDPIWDLSHSDCLALGAVLDEIERLRAIVAKLPKTADGAPVVPGMTLFYIHPKGKVYSVLIGFDLDETWVNYAANGDRARLGIGDCYSTRAAAEAAGGK
jgi:hypothetical protein